MLNRLVVSLFFLQSFKKKIFLLHFTQCAIIHSTSFQILYIFFLFLFPFSSFCPHTQISFPFFYTLSFFIWQPAKHFIWQPNSKRPTNRSFLFLYIYIIYFPLLILYTFEFTYFFNLIMFQIWIFVLKQSVKFQNQNVLEI